MRLQPIDTPKSLAMRVAYWRTFRKFGKVMTPMKVVLARMPQALGVMRSLTKLELNGLRLEPELRYLIGALTSRLNGCDSWNDFDWSMAIRSGISLLKFSHLDDYQMCGLFSERERAALAYAEEATRDHRVRESTFGELRKRFNDREIAEITWVVALENYRDFISLPLEIGSDDYCVLTRRRIAEAVYPRY